MKYIITFVLSFIISQQINAQIKSTVKSIIEQQEYNPDHRSILFEIKNSDSVLFLIERYRNAEIEDIRNQSYKLLVTIKQTTKDTLYKVKCIEKIVLSQFDNSEYIRNGICESLITFNKPEFSSIAIESLKDLSLPQNKKFITEKNILLFGFLGIRISHVENLAKNRLNEDFNFSYNKVWNSKLCLSRMGDLNMNKKCIDIIRKVNKNHLSYIASCNYTSYIRSKEAINILNDLLDSDLTMPKSSKKAAFNGEPYASHALFALRNIIINMPIKKKCESCYSMEEIRDARTWMKNNKGKYEIDTQNF